MKKTLLTLLSALFATAAWSATYFGAVNVELTDGTTVDIDLSSNLALNFNATHLQVTGTDADFEIPKEKIASFTHTKTSGLREFADDSSIDIKGRTITYKGLADGTAIGIYSLNGQCVHALKATSGTCTVELNDLPAGVYIITANNVSYKISLK